MQGSPSLLLPTQGDSEESNTTGLAVKWLVDVQRFIACKKVLQQEHLVNIHLGAELKLVVGMTKVFSARSNLLFRSNASLRTGWGRTGVMMIRQ